MALQFQDPADAKHKLEHLLQRESAAAVQYNDPNVKTCEEVPNVYCALNDFRELQGRILSRDHHLWESGLVVERLLELAPERIAAKLRGATKTRRNKLNSPELRNRQRAKIQKILTEWRGLKTCLKLDTEHAAKLSLATLENLVSTHTNTAILAEQGCDHGSAKILELETRAGMQWSQILEHLATARYCDQQVTHQLNCLIERNMGLAEWVASRTNAYGEPFEDKRQNGFIGLRKAILNFNPERGFKFSSFAVPMIQSTIRRAAQRESRTVELPSHVYEKLKKIRDFEDLYRSKNPGCLPSPDDTAAATKIERSAVLDLLPHRLPIVSLDEPLKANQASLPLELLSENYLEVFSEGVNSESFFNGHTGPDVTEEQRSSQKAA